MLTVLVPFLRRVNLYPLLHCFNLHHQLINSWPLLGSSGEVLVTPSMTSVFVLNCYLLHFNFNANF